MKKSVKLFGFAVLAALTLVACKNNATEEVVDSFIDSTIETFCDDTLAIAEDTVTVAEVAKAAKKAATKEEPAATSVKKTSFNPNTKTSAKEVASEMKEADHNGSTTSTQLTTNKKKNAREAFKKNN